MDSRKGQAQNADSCILLDARGPEGLNTGVLRRVILSSFIFLKNCFFSERGCDFNNTRSRLAWHRIADPKQIHLPFQPYRAQGRSVVRTHSHLRVWNPAHTRWRFPHDSSQAAGSKTIQATALRSVQPEHLNIAHQVALNMRTASSTNGKDTEGNLHKTSPKNLITMLSGILLQGKTLRCAAHISWHNPYHIALADLRGTKVVATDARTSSTSVQIVLKPRQYPLHASD